MPFLEDPSNTNLVMLLAVLCSTLQNELYFFSRKKKSFIELGIPNSKKFLYLDMKKGNQDGLLKSYVQAHFYFSK